MFCKDDNSNLSISRISSTWKANSLSNWICPMSWNSVGLFRASASVLQLQANKNGMQIPAMDFTRISSPLQIIYIRTWGTPTLEFGVCPLFPLFLPFPFHVRQLPSIASETNAIVWGYPHPFLLMFIVSTTCPCPSPLPRTPARPPPMGFFRAFQIGVVGLRVEAHPQTENPCPEFTLLKEKAVVG